MRACVLARSKGRGAGERRTEDEGVGEERGECDEEAAEAAADVCELGGFAGGGEGGVVGGPVDGGGVGGVGEGVVGEGVGVCALAVVSFLRVRGASDGARRCVGREGTDLGQQGRGLR